MSYNRQIKVGINPQK